MKPRAALLVLLALACLPVGVAAQSRAGAFRKNSKPEVQFLGAYHRTKLLSMRTSGATAQFGSVARRTLLTTGRLPAAATKRTHSRHSRR
jgi:hypothetical protein